MLSLALEDQFGFLDDGSHGRLTDARTFHTFDSKHA